jgi:hypothetical protein
MKKYNFTATTNMSKIVELVKNQDDLVELYNDLKASNTDQFKIEMKGNVWLLLDNRKSGDPDIHVFIWSKLHEKMKLSDGEIQKFASYTVLD